MTSPHEIPVMHVKLSCKDEPDFHERIAESLGRDGVFVPRRPPLTVGSRVLLRLHWTDGTIGVRGEAVVNHASSTGQTLKLVTLDPESVQFALADYPVAEPDYNRFGPWTDPAPVAGPATKVDMNGWPLPRMSAPSAQAPSPEAPRPSPGGRQQLPTSPRVLFGRYWLLVPMRGGEELDAWAGSYASGADDETLCIVKAARSAMGDVTPQGRAMLRRMKAIASLNHPNLVRMIEAGEISGRPFAAFEHLHGRSLAAILARFRAVQIMPPMQLAVTLGLCVARALEYLHTRLDAHARLTSVIHGEVNAENVYVGQDGEVQLQNLGINAPPPVAPTIQTDLHAAGGLIHDLLTVARPDTASQLGSKGRRHRAPSEWDRSIPESIDRLVLSSTGTAGVLKFTTVRELRMALEQEQARLGASDLSGTMLELFGPTLERERAELGNLARAAAAARTAAAPEP